MTERPIYLKAGISVQSADHLDVWLRDALPNLVDAPNLTTAVLGHVALRNLRSDGSAVDEMLLNEERAWLIEKRLSRVSLAHSALIPRHIILNQSPNDITQFKIISEPNDALADLRNSLYQQEIHGHYGQLHVASAVGVAFIPFVLYQAQLAAHKFDNTNPGGLDELADHLEGNLRTTPVRLVGVPTLFSPPES